MKRKLNQPIIQKNKMKTWKKVVLLIAITFLAIVILAASAVAIYIGVTYSKMSENTPIVDREEEYVLPDLPEEGIEEIPEDEDTAEPDDTDVEADVDAEPEGEEIEIPADTNESTPTEPAPIYRREPLNPDVINVLLLGRDTRKAQLSSGVNGRSDSMIIASFNKTTGEVTLTSIMRDSLVPIEGYGWNRINAAYSYGGIGLAINTVNNVFELDIQDYVIIDFEGIENLVDSLGGVEVTLTAKEVSHYQAKYGRVADGLSAGVNNLSGKQALMHARNRQVGNDFERTRRQRDILASIFNEVKAMDGLGSALSFVNSATSLVTTNMSMGEITSLATSLFNGNITITNARVPCDGSYKNIRYYGASVLQIDIQKNIDYIYDIINN